MCAASGAYIGGAVSGGIWFVILKMKLTRGVMFGGDDMRKYKEIDKLIVFDGDIH